MTRTHLILAALGGAALCALLIARPASAGLVGDNIWAITGSPSVPTDVTAAVSTSAANTGLVGGSCIRFSCDSDVAYRTGSGTPTAVTTDNLLRKGDVEKFCIRKSESAIAFVSSVGTWHCRVSLLANYP